VLCNTSEITYKHGNKLFICSFISNKSFLYSPLKKDLDFIIIHSSLKLTRIKSKFNRIIISAECCFQLNNNREHFSHLFSDKVIYSSRISSNLSSVGSNLVSSALIQCPHRIHFVIDKSFIV
jgi:hypothetical protein